ncbi:membrane-associating domain-containing protein [Lipomyces chichibuensis]|uniref:membrane-associating domain-containing protein n=1 Tax=Lipomyces chichibuensis TaxID=1546026 RepID=UPI00334369F6
MAMGGLFISNIVLRSLLFAFLVITLGLTGSLIAGQNFGTPQVNFMMFASVFGLLFGALYGFIGLFLTGMAFPFAVAVVDFLVTVFAFAGATALAVVIRVHSCTNDLYLNTNRVAQGSTSRCRKAQADTVFMYFAFIVSLIALILSITTGFRTGWGTVPSRHGAAAPAPAAAAATTRPTMTQV